MNHLKNLVSKNNFQILFSICIAAIIYFLFAFSLGFPKVADEKNFSTPDAQEYLYMGKWIWGNEDGIFSQTRPFLFPFILQIFYFLLGKLGIWLLNFLLWMATAHFIFLTVKNLTNFYFALVSITLFCLNASLIASTFYALAEVTTTFLIALSVFVITKVYLTKSNRPVFILPLIFSALSLTKPLYIFPFYFLLAVCLLLILTKNHQSRFRKILFITFSLLLYFIQMSLMKNETHEFVFSEIGDMTLKKYYYSKFYAD